MSLSLFRRNLAKYGKVITLQNRNIAASNTGLVDFNEVFSDDLIVRAIVQTPRGKTIFDGVSVDQVITHKMCIEFVEGVTSETTSEAWVLYDGNRYDIIDVENCGEQDVLLILRCNIRGLASKEASKT